MTPCSGSVPGRLTRRAVLAGIGAGAVAGRVREGRPPGTPALPAAYVPPDGRLVGDPGPSHRRVGRLAAGVVRRLRRRAGHEVPAGAAGRTDPSRANVGRARLPPGHRIGSEEPGVEPGRRLGGAGRARSGCPGRSLPRAGMVGGTTRRRGGHPRAPPPHDDDGADRVAGPGGGTRDDLGLQQHHLPARPARARAGQPGSASTLTRRRLFDPIGVSDQSFWYERPGTAPTSVDPTGRRLWGLMMTARDLARVGLLVQRAGSWADDEVLPETELARGASTLTGDEPKLRRAVAAERAVQLDAAPTTHTARFPRPRRGPTDAVAALGKDDQKLYVSRAMGSCSFGSASVRANRPCPCRPSRTRSRRRLLAAAPQ